jgi:hypothetical protein
MIFFAVFVLMMAACQKKAFQLDAPKKVKIKIRGMIYANEFPDSKSRQIGVVKYGEEYDVLDVWPGCYKISTPDSTGWIWANAASNWTKIVDENTVKIMLKGGLALRKDPFNTNSPVIGIAAPGYTFEVLETEFAYFKVQLPDGKAGWIYAGLPKSRWVEGIR